VTPKYTKRPLQRNFMRFPAIPLLIALLVALASAVVVPNSLRLAAVSKTLVSDLAAQGGIEVSFEDALEDSVRLRILPRPQVIFTNLSIVSSAQASVQVAAKLPRVVVDLDITELMQRRLRVKSVHLINANITGKFSQSPQGFLSSLLPISQPGLYMVDSRVVASGLNRNDTSKTLQLSALSLAMPRRMAGEPLKLSMQHPTGIGELAQFSLQLSEREAAIAGAAVDVQASLRLALNEKIGFVGSVTRQANWRLDGELSLSSVHMMADVLEHYLPLAISPEARSVAFSGLVRGDATGLRSQNLEISALNSLFQSRLALDWPDALDTENRAGPLLIGRLSTGSLNLDALRAAPKKSSSPPPASRLWHSLAPDLGMGLRLEANQFELGGETGSNLLLAFDWRGEEVDIERLSLNLPFRSALLAVGTLNIAQAAPTFEGSFSARSSDGLAAMIWAGNQLAADVSGFAENIDPSRLQRLSLVGDIDWTQDSLALKQLAGRLEDDRVSGEITFQSGSATNVTADLDFSRLDMSDWGITDVQANRNIKLAAVWQPLTRAMETWLQTPDAQRKVELRLTTDQLYSGTQSFGPVKMRAQVRDQFLNLTEAQFSDFSGAQISAKGQMSYTDKLPHGGLTVQLTSPRVKDLTASISRRFPFISVATDTPISVTGNLLLTAPGAPDFPDVKFTGFGKIGDLDAHFNVITPSRSLDYGVAGSTILMSLEGSANAVARPLRLSARYEKEALGRLQVALDTQSADVTALRADLVLSDDKAGLSGNLRPTAEGPLLEGALSFTTKNLLSVLGVQSGETALPASARGQVNVSAKTAGFSGIEGQLGDGKMNIDGILQLTGSTPQLAADIILDAPNLTWLLPEWGAKGWSQKPMSWPLLGRVNADMNLRLLNTNLGSILIDSAAARLKLIEGVLEVPEIKVQLLGGQVSANLQAEGGSLNPYFNLEASFTDLRPPSLSATKAKNPVWDAAHQGSLALRGRGTSVAAMMGSMSGALQVDAGAGSLGFLDVTGLSRDLASAQGAGVKSTAKAADLVARYRSAGDATFERGVGVAQIRNGRVETASADLIFAPPFAAGQMKAKVDLVTQEVIAKVQLPTGQSGRNIIWDIAGTLAKPKVKLDVSQIIGPVKPSEPNLK
jgi:hypothetical protein